MASANYRTLATHLATAAVNFSSASFKCMLLTAMPSESDLDTHVFRSSITTETSGSGYTAGGVAVTMTVSSLDTTNNRVSITPSNLSPGWATASISAAAAVIYQDTGSSATDKLIAAVDFGGTFTSTAGPFSVTFSTPLYITIS